MLKLYTDTSYLTEAHRGKIFPLLLGLHYKELPLVKDNFVLTENIKDADVFVLPLHVEYVLKYKKQVYQNFLALSKHYNKPLWGYSSGDFGTTLHDAVYTFRLGGFKNKYQVENTLILPSFISDPYKNSLSHAVFTPLDKKLKPTIGFVGHATNGWEKWSKEFVIFLKYNTDCYLGKRKTDKQKFFPSSIYRFDLLQRLESSTGLESDFIYRKQYRAGANSEALRKQTTLDYFSNMENNLYTLCVRGVGNFSVRFYETLAVGRIPVYIDTNGGLPLESHIDWDKHILRISWKQRHLIAEVLVDFHNSKSNEELKQIQRSNRALWEEIGHVGGYFKAVSDNFNPNKL
ncbi:exostosin family protein [Tamlana agarivorans]|uniref:Exostosin family protein n=1 Tax=Pseudotamlana agarivorans TaxID=481183 RepID=A0ACC5UCQ7_9FLAO|nr:exostosin family protein [Tamlana agarivorans]MBU2952138.1 exostosin family protein [Tamlana agarivorans]